MDRSTGRGGSSRPIWPVWALLAATVFLMGFRTTLNVVDSNVIDVGLAGIDGGQRIVQGEMPYGHMPTDDGKACGLPDSDGYVREHVQTNGRCESANERGDTYGPVSYLACDPHATSRSASTGSGTAARACGPVCPPRT